MGPDGNLIKDDLDGIKFWSADKMEISHTIKGTDFDFPPIGYVLDVFPSDTDKQGFIDKIN